MAMPGALQDTIAAIATPLGPSGIGIVRISGPEARRIAETIFRPRRDGPLITHQIRYGEIVDPKGGGVIDEVLLTYMKAPHTYTREDVVEINAHGGFEVLRRILEIVLQQGARGAMPGEFTKRAFLSGRIDLAQAEAVLEVIQAKTAEGLRLAEEQLRGRLSSEVKCLQGMLLDLLIPIEAYIDIYEEDIDIPSRERILEVLETAKGRVELLIAAHEEGEVYREGVRVAIVGKANVGKSSLLNRMLGRERAIVTSIPGTTTDLIEESLNISGVLIRLVDMAGMRQPRNEVEAEGVRRARGAISEAGLIVLVVDRSTPLDDEDLRIFQDVKGKRLILVLNKIDLPSVLGLEEVRRVLGVEDIFPISALRGEGIEELKKGLVEAVLKGRGLRVGGDLVPVNLRHKRILDVVRGILAEGIQGVQAGIPWDLTAMHIREAIAHLGEIVGVTTPEEVLEEIFSRFCVGK